MKRTTSILICLMVAGLAWAQSPQVIRSTRSNMQTEKKATAASKPAAGAHNATVKTGASPFKTGSPAPAHAPASSSGVAVLAPVKSPSAQAGASPAGVKKMGGASRVPVSRNAQPKPVIPVPANILPTNIRPTNNPPAASTAADKGAAGEGESALTEEPVAPDSKYNANGRRDPFISPVVSHAGGSGCSTGKKCLEIGAINLRGVVHYENGFIAVVSNGLNKAYFLRENDPVFNGYVVKITGDSIVFQETLQDRLGKTFTREVVKKITTPAV
jgi:hypothetical protein